MYINGTDAVSVQQGTRLGILNRWNGIKHRFGVIRNQGDVSPLRGPSDYFSETAAVCVGRA